MQSILVSLVLVPSFHMISTLSGKSCLSQKSKSFAEFSSGSWLNKFDFKEQGFGCSQFFCSYNVSNNQRPMFRFSSNVQFNRTIDSWKAGELLNLAKLTFREHGSQRNSKTLNPVKTLLFQGFKLVPHWQSVKYKGFLPYQLHAPFQVAWPLLFIIGQFFIHTAFPITDVCS